MSTARDVANTAIFTALCVVLQSAPVFLPGAGMLISPFSTLPILVAAMLSAGCGVMTLLCSTAILLFISPEEAAIFFFATGSFGLSLGASIHRKAAVPVLLSAGSLFIGLLALTYAIGIPAFGSLTDGFPLYAVSFVFLAFSLCYSTLWLILVKSLLKGLVQSTRKRRRSGGRM
jgi:riboflavin transporter FmnP